MASISSPGTGSGIDVNALVSDILRAESEPTLFRLAEREAELQAQISGLGLLRADLESVQSSVEDLLDVDLFRRKTASIVGGDEEISASASPSAVASSYSIDVSTLATAQKLASVGFSDATAEVGSGRLIIQPGSTGTPFTVDIPSSAKTLADVRDAINAASGNPGVSATLITVDAVGGGSETRLVLNAADTGTESALTVTVVDDDGNHTDALGLSRLTFDPNGSGVENMSENPPAIDASLTIDGQTVTSSSNSISEAIEGVTIDLASTTDAGPVTLTIGDDRGAIITAITGFASAYSSFRGTVTQLTDFDAETGQAGILIGDSGVRTVVSQFQRQLSFQFDTGGEFDTLSSVGISVQSDGTLSIDSDRLNQALDDDPESLRSLFSGTEGFARNVDNLLSGFVSGGGVLELRNEALTRRIDDINSQRETLNRRLTNREATLLAQFNAMDAIVSQLQTTSTFLTQQLSALRNLSSDES
jgi:flagellar hook-associated protein 2